MVVVDAQAISVGDTIGFETAGCGAAEERSERGCLVYRHVLPAVASAKMIPLSDGPGDLGVEAGGRLGEREVGRVVVSRVANWRIGVQRPVLRCGCVYLLQDRQRHRVDPVEWNQVVGKRFSVAAGACVNSPATT